MRSRRHVRQNPAPAAKTRRKSDDSGAQSEPPNRIRELRRRARMSLQDLSDLTGEPIQTLSRWETKGGLSVEKLARLAGALRARPADLVHGERTTLSADEQFILDRFAAASPQVRAMIVRTVSAMTEEYER